MGPPINPLKLAKRFISDKFALASSTFISIGLRLGTTVVMGRLLLPSDYGLYTLVTIAPFLITSFGDFSIPGGVVQIRNHSEQTVIDTGMFLGMFLGIINVIAYVVGGYYLYAYSSHTIGDHTVLRLALIIGFGNALNLYYAIQLSVINRAQKYGTESKQNIIFSLTSAVTGITLGFSGFGVYALAIQSVVAQIISCVLISRHIPFQWPRQVTLPAIKTYAKFCSGLTASNYISNFESKAFEYCVLKNGGVNGKTRLGEWGRGLTILSLVSQNFNVAIDRVIYPAICSAQFDIKRIRELSRRHLEALLIMSGFVTAWLYCNSDDVVRVIMGRNWSSLPPMLKILAFAVPLQALTSAGHVVCVALGKTMQLTIRTTLRFVVIVPLLYLIITRGNGSLSLILGLLLLAKAIDAFTQIGFAWGITGIPPLDTFKRIFGMAISSVLLAMVFHLMKTFVHEHVLILSGNSLLISLLRVTLMSLFGIATYSVLLHVLARESVEYVFTMIKGKK